jgi:radical SAM superfamily enzyme YgiQ (UPF0313 family)
MKILILDPYPESNFRISKDTSGGYGTGNDFGDTIIPVILKKILIKNSCWPPLFAAYVFSCLKKNKHEIKYTQTLPVDINDYELIIIVSSIVSHETEIEKIKEIKKINNNKKIFIIGPFATNNATLYEPYDVTIVIGEPEFFFYKEKNLNKFFNEKKIYSKQESTPLEDLPYPDFESMGYSLSNVNNLFGNKKSIPILGTRGCPFSCFKYCVYPLQQGRKVRQRSPIDIVKEMKYWKEKHKVNMFIFRDPVFSINKNHTIEFCNELIKSNLNIEFIIETHLKILDTELILILKKAGLKGVKVGIESYAENVLAEAKRHTETKDQQLSKITELHNNKIMVSAMYILGFPEDNEDSITKTINYSIKLNTAYAQYSVWTPYPGTPVFSEYKDKINAKKFEEFNQYQLVFNHKILSNKKIRELLSLAYTKYYLRLKWFLHYIKLYYL